MADRDTSRRMARPLHRRATLKDVAEAAGVSLSTTSRALSGQGYVASPVRSDVLAAAERLGYVAHAMARNLRTQSSRSIGVLISDLRNTFYADLAAGIAAGARTHGYSVVLVDDNADLAEEAAAAQTFVSMRAAGVIVTPLSGHVSSYLAKQHIATVEVDREFADGSCDAVIIDNEAAARRLTSHLIELGHKCVAFLTDETAWTTGERRLSGYRAALAAAGLTDAEIVIDAGWNADSARVATVDVLGRESSPTAIFAANNVVAEGVWRAAADLGVSIPDDVSMVSFDDAKWMNMVTPPVTAIAQDAQALGRAAVEMLMSRISSPDTPTQKLVLSADLIKRASTAVPKASASNRPRR